MSQIRQTGIPKMEDVKIPRIQSIPSIQLEVDDALERRCSILFPGKNLESPAEQQRNGRKASFATFQIVDENNCGMSAFVISSIQSNVSNG